jgi:hypothetical protein
MVPTGLPELLTGEAQIGIWQGCQRQKVMSVPPDPATPWPLALALFSQEPNRWCGVWKAGTSGYRVRCAEITPAIDEHIRDQGRWVSANNGPIMDAAVFSLAHSEGGVYA